MSEPEATQLILRAAEEVLARRFGGPVRLDEADAFGGTVTRSGVMRGRLLEGPGGAPETVIVKRLFPPDGSADDPADGKHSSPAWRLFNEWAGLEFLRQRCAGEALAAQALGADPVAGLLVLEDLGDGECLADRLQGSDRARAEAALAIYAATLGKVHAATIGGEAEYQALRAALGAPPAEPPPSEDRLGVWLSEDLPGFRAACARLEAAPAAGFEEEMAAVAAALAEPGPFLAFSPGDTCPDNHRIAGDRMRLFDFEWAGFRHALLDGVYWTVPFPTCWCVSRLPDALLPRLDAAYRAELARGCPEASDDERFYRVVALACAAWLVSTVRWQLEQALEADREWGISTIRQRQLLRLDRFARVAEQFGALEATGATARELARRLRDRWPPEAEMPLYLPFREERAGEAGLTTS